MTKLVAGLLIALLVVVKSVAAQPITVRAGEHADFTRLVMQLPDAVTWELSPEYGKVLLNFEGLADGFDLSGTFDVVPRTRLVDATSTGSQLVLELACECPVTSFTEQGNYLVIDVQDGPPLELADAPIAEIPEKINRSLPVSEFRYGDLLWNTEVEEPTIAGALAEPELNVEEELEANRNREIFLETQRNLLSAFGEAIAQGVVDADFPPQIEPIADAPIVENSVEVYDSSSAQAQEQSENSQHIKITTSEDIPPFHQAETNENLNSSAAQCIDPGGVNLSSWGTDEGYDRQISRSNSAIYDELGQLDEREALSRVKLLLFFGFGAEALEILEIVSQIQEQHPELVDLAQIMERGYAPNPRILHQFSDCPTDVALWAILAGKEISGANPTDKNAALRALKKLPPHLREFIGAALADRFFTAGDQESAKIATRTSELSKKPDEVPSNLVKANLPAQSGNVDSSKQLLSEVIAANDMSSPQALIDLIELHVRQNDIVPTELALLVEAFAVEYRGSSTGRALQKTHVLSSAGSGQFEKVLEEISSLEHELTKKERTKTSDYIATMLTKNSSDIEFAEYLIDHREIIGSHLSESTVVLASARLLKLGFPEAVLQLFELNPTEYPSRNRLMLSAEADIAVGNAGKAILSIVNLDGPDVELLRANAALVSGDNNAAMTAFAAAENIDLSQTAAWLSEEWRQNIDPSDTLFGEVQQIANEQIQPISSTGSMLSDSADALDSAARTRATITNLIATLENRE